jgi:exodeoxyribonuclease V gamma subunit
MSTPARIHLISGNRLDALAAELGTRIARTDDPDSLAPETILIPQPSLRQWLSQALAERFGVAANLDLLTPSEFVWRLLHAANDTPLPESSPWDRERLHWRAYALLERSDAQALPPALRRYLRHHDTRDGDAGARALARYDLAGKVAAAFERYQAYRRDWLEAWEHGQDRDDWQAALWRALRETTEIPHRAALIGAWLARYDRREARANAASAPPGLPSRLSAFGTMHVSPDVLRMLAVAGQWCALDFYLPTPSAEYWGDVESLRERLRRDGADAIPQALADLQRDNPLLSAWGSGGRDILASVFSYEIVQPQTELERFVDSGRDTLLHRLQHDILHRAAPRAEPWSRHDVSVQIHACHSKFREIEILHDRLRAMLDNDRFDPPLQPREIAVMAPEIAEYLPLARAVFGGLDPNDPRYIPFTLADRPQTQAHALIAWFLALLELSDAPLRVGAFRDVIAYPPVMQCMGLSQDDLARLDAWFAAAGIRWGEDAAARERAGVGHWREYSFDFGFERLLAGYAAGDDASLDTSDGAAIIAPYSELEGGDAETLDRALEVYARLRALASWMREPHPAAQWRQRLSEAVLGLIGASAQDNAEAQARRWLLDALDAFAEHAADAGPLVSAVVREALRVQLSQASMHQPWLAGGVVFSGMVPLRTVPFRVICLLGLDAEAYPRREPGQDVDRLVDAVQGRVPRRLGDRSVRDDDRFLFLQLLCAARDTFYLSYGGRDARDDRALEPAGPVAELLDAIESMDGGCIDSKSNVNSNASAKSLREHCTLEHPLQPFSRRAFGDGGSETSSSGLADEPRRFSYRDEWRIDTQNGAPVASPPFLSDNLPPRNAANADAPEDAPTRDALQAFFSNPARAWLSARLGLRLPRSETALEEREPLGDDALQRYRTIMALLRDDAARAQDNIDDPHARNELQRDLRARGILAPGRDGEHALEDALPLTQALVRATRELRVGANADEEISASTPVDFAFRDVWRDTDGACVRLQPEAGKLDGKRRLRAWLDHLLLASIHGANARTVLIGEGEAKASSKRETANAAPPVESVAFENVGVDDARARLRGVMALWREGQARPLPFAPKAAWAYVDTLRKKNGDARAAWREAGKVFDSDRGGDAHDPYFALAFRANGLFDAYDSPQARRFREIAVEIFGASPESKASNTKPAAGIATPTTSTRKRRPPSEPAA